MTKSELEEYWEYLTSYSIATEEELSLVTSMNGYNEETLNSVLYVRTGYRSLEQIKDIG